MALKGTSLSPIEHDLSRYEEERVASCEDVYVAKDRLAHGRFSWTVFFGCLMAGEVIGAIVLIGLCFAGVIDPESWASVVPLACGAIVGAIPGIFLAR